MATTLLNNGIGVKAHQYHSLLADAELLSVPDEEDEADLDDTKEIESAEKESSPPPAILPTNTSIPIRPWSDFSIATTSMPTKKSPSYPLSRSYKFVQLERALTSAGLLENNEDRIKFEKEYRGSLRQNTFEEFLNKFYQKIRDHREEIKQARALEKSRTFTFVDLEKNFLAQDPARDIKIVFIDDLMTSSTSKKTEYHFNAFIHRNSTLSQQTDDGITEAFYADRSHRLLRNPSRAHDEITLFARRAGELLHERLPRLSSDPHRVKLVDQREKKGKADERTLLQMKHKHALSLIANRRHLLTKMMTQAQKNQIKMEKQEKQTLLTLYNSSCCRELLEQANQIEQTVKEEQIQRPYTGMFSPGSYSKTTSSAYQTTMISTSIAPSFSSCSVPFQDALSIYHVEKAKNVQVLLPTRPHTAPTNKLAWINYC